MPRVRKIAPPPDDEPDDELNEDEEYDDNDERSAYGYDGWGWYKPSKPIRTDKGIKARSQRGAFGESWWARRWIAALDQFGWGSRLQRGKTYARKGQVLSIDFAGAKIKAKVQGSRRTPYSVTIEMKPLSDAQWEQVADALAQQAIFAAKLLAGEMPQDIETAFEAAGVPLFPRGARDISADCSCPDFANPCKHIAAVYYLLGERFDEDPFLIFQARGRSRERIVAALRARRGQAADAPEVVMAAPAEAAPALADLLETFYAAGPELETIEPRIAPPAIEAALLRRLGPAPAGTDADLPRLYQAISARALERVLGEELKGES
jgi:uncharacterized Zn finger protein